MSTELEDVKDDLSAQSIVVHSVHNIYSSRNMLPLMLTKVRRDQDKIFKTTRCLNLLVRIERLRVRTLPGQCYKCQRYDHCLTYCKMQLRCIHCGQEHRAAVCGRPKKEPATCALCNKTIQANYRGCAYAPKPRKANSVTKGWRFAVVVGKKPEPKAPEKGLSLEPSAFWDQKQDQDPPGRGQNSKKYGDLPQDIRELTQRKSE